MKVYKRNEISSSKLKSYFENKKIYKSLLYSLLLILILSLIFSLIYLGATLQKRQTASNIQEILFDATKSKFEIFENYITGLFSKPDVLYVDIGFKEKKLLDFARKNSLSRGIINDEDQDIEVNAKITLNDNIYRVKISPTGQNLDMIGDPNKRAYKVKVLDGKKIFGMPEFKILPPKTRHNLVEWVGHALEKKEGLISLRYFFTKIYLNGENLGIFAIEEHFTKEMLKYQGAREGLLFKIDKNLKPVFFNQKKILNIPNQKYQNKILKSAIQSLDDNSLEIQRLFDLKKFAKYLAIIELMYGYHAILDINSFYYFNPITKLVEPIIREYNSMRYSDGPPKDQSFVFNKIISNADDFIILNKLFNNQDFVKIYLNELNKITRDKYLNSLFDEIDDELNIQLSILYKDNPFYKFPKEYLYLRQKQILNYFNNNNFEIIANLESHNNGIKNLSINNKSPFPIFINSIKSDDESFEYSINKITAPGEIIYIKFDNLSLPDINNYIFTYKIEGINNSYKEKIIPNKSSVNNNLIPFLWSTSDKKKLNDLGIKYDVDDQKILFDKNLIVINEDIYFPEGYSVIGFPGLTIDLVNNASIFSKSSFFFNGNSKKKISIISSSGDGGGVLILNTKDENIFNYVDFINLNSPHRGMSGITSSLSFYETNAKIKNSNFFQNKSEDFLNFIRTDFIIENSTFKDVNSDALDSDFSTGEINNSSFYKIGNDALDFSGSKIKINSIYIENVGDKALSAGEGSFVDGVSIDINQAEIGITSKDKSEVLIEDLKIKNTKLDFAIFKKKEEYGGAFASVSEFDPHQNNYTYLVEEGSVLFIENEEMKNKSSGVEELLYGNVYGKSSK